MSKSNHDSQNPITAVEQEVVETTTPEPVVQDNLTATITGRVVNCARVNVREEASMTANVLTTLASGTAVEVDKKKSTKEFFKVWTEAGLEGWIKREFVEL